MTAQVADRPDDWFLRQRPDGMTDERWGEVKSAFFAWIAAGRPEWRDQ